MHDPSSPVCPAPGLASLISLQTAAPPPPRLPQLERHPTSRLCPPAPQPSLPGPQEVSCGSWGGGSKRLLEVVGGALPCSCT